MLIEVHLCTAINCSSQLEENDLFSMASLRLFTPWEFVDLSLSLIVFNTLISFWTDFWYFYDVSKNGTVFRLSFEFIGIFPALKAFFCVLGPALLCLVKRYVFLHMFCVLWASWSPLWTICLGISSEHPGHNCVPLAQASMLKA